MAKCASCGRFIAQTDGITCSICPCSYHQACLGKGKTIKTNKPWSCPECNKNKKRDNGDETPAKGNTELRTSTESLHCYSSAPSSVEKEKQIKIDLAVEVRLFRQDLQALKEEVVMMREDMKELRNTISVNNKRIDSLEERVNALEQGANSKQDSAAHFEALISALRLELNEKDQELLANDIEITNLPELLGILYTLYL